MLYKGYCGSTYQSWGLECDDDLYYATKVAVHCFAEGISPDDKYELPHRVGWGQDVTLEDVQRRGAKVLNVARNIYNYGMTSSDNYIKASVSVSKNGGIAETTINGTKYVIQNYSTTANKELESYTVSITNFPTGTRILNNSNTDATNMTNSNFKIAIPTSAITDNFKGYINITNAKVKSYPIFYANSGNDDTQNYIITDPTEVTTARSTLDIDAYKSTLKIVKTDDESNNALKGVKFNVKYDNNSNIGDFVTNAQGIITINNLKPGKVIITEKSTLESYVIDTTPQEVTLKYGESKTVNIYNQHKKGNLVIQKVDADNHSVVLQNITFKVFDSSNNLIATLKTNSQGIARLDNINTGRYKIVETTTNEFYNLNTEEKFIDVKCSTENGDSTILIENNKKTGFIEINKYDAENSSKKIGNVKFGLYDNNNTLIQTLVTDNNGYAKSNKLPMNKLYYVKELQTDDNYILNTSKYNVNFAETGLVDGYTYKLNIPNNHKKGNLVIKKVDANDHSVVLENISFKIFDSNDKLIATLKTNKQGIARLDNINIGNYKILEIETNQYYRLNTEENILNVKYSAENGDSEIIIENEQKRGYIEITKYDKDAFEKHNRTLGVADVVFGIFDEQGNKIEELTTDSNGYAKSSALSLMQKYVVKELKTREEYIINNNEFKVNLTENGIIDNYKYQLRVANEHKKGNLHIEKITVDDKTIQLGNVGFELYLVGNGEIKLLIDTYYTDANGEIYIENLNTGKYILKEISTNRWYYLPDDKPIEIKWSKEFGNTHVTIENEKKKGIIKVIKKDNDFTELPLENVKFNVYDEDNNFIETITTNNEGIAESSRLRIDKKYHMVECETLQNYILDDIIYTIDFTEGLSKDQINDIQVDSLKTLELKNQHKKGNLVIHKVDALDNTIPVEGVTFELYVKNIDQPYTENQLIGTYITNTEGKIEIDNLWTGEYYLKETATNLWYKLNTDDTNLEINENETTEVTITNEAKRGYITIEKQDSELSNIKIPDVTFNIYDESGNFIESIKTDQNGIAKSSLLIVDKSYYVVEVATNESYILKNEFFRVNFVEGKTNEDIEHITTDLEYNLLIENDIKKGAIQVVKVDADNNEIKIPGVEFDVIDETTNEKIDTITTNEAGLAIIDNLRIDKQFSLLERKTNHKYKFNETKIEHIQINANEQTVVNVENEKIKGQLRVIKVDNENHEVRIPNVEFEILDSNMNVIETLTTDENGEAVSSKLPCIEETYYLRESKNNEFYELSNELITVTLTENEITDIIFENNAKTSSLEIIKIDADNNEYKIANAIFEIIDETTGKIVTNVTTDENGRALVENLKVTHIYSAKEVKANYKYKLNEEMMTNIIVKPNEITHITFENEKLKGQLRVIKVDADNNEYRISNVTFEILDSNMNVIETLTTDENGEALSSKLPCVEENYYLREVSTQDTYVLSNEIKEFTLTQDEITNITFENEKIKGKLEITKIDKKDTNKTLQDAVFGIFDENNNLIQKITTNKNGIALSDDIIIGKYYCKELETGSPYYLLNENTYEFEIKTNGEVVKQKIDNEPVDITVDVDKEGTIEIKPGEFVNYKFSNVANNSNVYLENFKWFDYIPTEYVSLKSMTTGTWNQDLTYSVYYKTNKSNDYILFKENLSTQEIYNLDFTSLVLKENEYIVETCFDFGKVDTGFRESISPTMKCKSFDTLQDTDKFTNYTKTVGIYYGVTAESNSKWTTIVHVPEEKHEPVLPRTGR